MINSLLYKLFDYRYVYCFQFGKSSYKIGISTDPKRRQSEIERKIGKKIKLKFKYRMFSAFKVEQKLHQKYRSKQILGLERLNHNFGKEWFKLDKVHLISVRLILIVKSGTATLLIISMFCLLLYLSFLLIQNILS